MARDSWAMRARVNLVAISVMSQALGNTAEKTTQFYLSSLDQTVIDQVNLKIINFVEKWANGKPCKN